MTQRNNRTPAQTEQAESQYQLLLININYFETSKLTWDSTTAIAAVGTSAADSTVGCSGDHAGLLLEPEPASWQDILALLGHPVQKASHKQPASVTSPPAEHSDSLAAAAAHAAALEAMLQLAVG